MTIPNKPYRIAIGAIFTESNHLGGKPTTLDDFARSELRRGAQVLDVATGYSGGMLQVLHERQATPVPLLVAAACPGGAITAACYSELKSDLLDRLKRELPVDGVAMPLHGAAAAEGVDDVEGDLLRAVRECVGPDIPIVASLDLHAHVTEAMMANADLLVALETYPHRDAFETGQRAARLLLDFLSGAIKPLMAMCKVPVLTSAVNGSTEGDDPFAAVMRYAKSHEGNNGVLSTSVFLVHPYLDAKDMGSGGLVITDSDGDSAVRLATDIAARYWAIRFELEPKVLTPEQAIAEGLQIEGGPVLLVETADCSGGGAAGDSIASLRALLQAQIDAPSLVPVVDPEAARLCHQAGEGIEITLSLGHGVDPQWGRPLSVTGTVLRLGSGRFQYSGGFWDGQWAEMGPCAVLQVGAVQVLITTNATYDWADEQYRAMDMNTAQAKFIVVKNPMNYRQGYADRAKAAFILDTPGPTPATLAHVRHKNMARPYYPQDKEIPALEMKVLQSKSRK